VSQTHPPVASRSQAVLRFITPVYNHLIQDADKFEHSGAKGQATFKLTFGERPTPTDWTAVAADAEPGVVEHIRKRAELERERFFGSPNHFLQVDVAGAPGSEAELGNSIYAVVEPALISLRLHSSAGLAYNETYSYWLPPTTLRGLHFNSLYSVPLPNRHLLGRSVLRAADFDACRRCIDGVLILPIGPEAVTRDRVLLLAIEYQRLSLAHERIEHAFLTLMVAFEALFKSGKEKNATKAAQRMGRLLGTTQKHCAEVQKEFNDYSRHRNLIAHGDPTLGFGAIADNLPRLYQHITAAIAELLELPAGSFDPAADYYGEVDRFTEARCQSLKRV
jgi:hypothetical protein